MLMGPSCLNLKSLIPYLPCPPLQASVEVVELDGKLVEVAERWFGFTPGERLVVHVSDGVEFIKKASADKPG